MSDIWYDIVDVYPGTRYNGEMITVKRNGESEPHEILYYSVNCSVGDEYKFWKPALTVGEHKAGEVVDE